MTPSASVRRPVQCFAQSLSDVLAGGLQSSLGEVLPSPWESGGRATRSTRRSPPLAVARLVAENPWSRKSRVPLLAPNQPGCRGR